MRLYKIESNLLEKYQNSIHFAINKYNDHNSVIYRGFQNLKKEFDVMIRDPRKIRRKGTSELNYHSLYIEGNAAWKAYPDRFYSVICSSNRESAADYGSIYVIIPIGNPTIAVCPTDDLWNSFDTKTELYNFHEMEDFNKEINRLLIKYQIIDKDYNITSYDDLIDKLSMLDKFDTRKELKSNKSVTSLFQNIYDPIDLNFKIIKWQKYKLTNKNKKEIWFSGPYIAMKPNIFFKLCEDFK